MDYKKRIKEKGLMKLWIATKMKISPTLLSFYLNGDRPIPDGRKKKLEEILA